MSDGVWYRGGVRVDLQTILRYSRRFFPDRMNGRNAHSTSASSASIVPSLIWYSFISNRGPISVSYTLSFPLGISYV